MPPYDVMIVGGGVVGLAVARALLAAVPSLRLLVLEKETEVGTHQTGHNSGVLHSGVYYRPGSLKAALCVEGVSLMVEFCQTYQIPHAIIGKVIVATQPEELPRLHALYQRGLANGIRGLTLVGPERLRELEPYANGLQALHVPSTGVVDFPHVARTFARLIQAEGGEVRTSTRVLRLLRRVDGWCAQTTTGAYVARYVITCPGLHADRLAAMAGARPDAVIVPFRGEYYELVPTRQSLVRSMIYPVPDPTLPFLGVHFTRHVDGTVHAGPNAVLALKREGYRKSDVDPFDTLRMFRTPAYWRMTRRYWQVGVAELWRSWNKPVFVEALQRLVPAVTATDLIEGKSGVRAQAVDRHGSLLDDFVIVPSHRAIHVLNVPSPAATASISLGRTIMELAVKLFELPAKAVGRNANCPEGASSL